MHMIITEIRTGLDLLLSITVILLWPNKLNSILERKEIKGTKEIEIGVGLSSVCSNYVTA